MTEEKKTETKTLPQADTMTWTCPFCETVNGTDEVTKCQCGAKRKGNEATK